MLKCAESLKPSFQNPLLIASFYNFLEEVLCIHILLYLKSNSKYGKKEESDWK
jgi:hypothetical protein